ncbi:hypothetical protein [Streptomyces sp900116325]|uniref:Uncharacterized protein n=1 Tax=Streptomyces sp. 900116325 TaxID=3154295 RepID=A0ABV2UGM6_9ACTN
MGSTPSVAAPTSRADLTNEELTGRLLDLYGAGWAAVTLVPDRKSKDIR